ncbi:MAG: hypothetical protein ACI8QS_000424 [Planctomycetota bacterium]|jgi:hypothetical protein
MILNRQQLTPPVLGSDVILRLNNVTSSPGLWILIASGVRALECASTCTLQALRRNGLAGFLSTLFPVQVPKVDGPLSGIERGDARCE